MNLKLVSHPLLWRIFALEREAVTRLQTILNLELHNIYPSSDIGMSRACQGNEVDETCSTHGREND
jgi:hypothetical protein